MPSPGPHPQLRFHPAEGAGPARFDVSGARVYMIGIGGSGMSGLARMLLSRGAVVSGSDREAGDATVVLEAAGVRVGFDQSAQALPGGLDLVVASAAIRPDHPQYAEAVRRGVPVLLYAETLGRCMLGRTGISVAGTHGKSTTTAMLGCVLTDCGLDPTVIVGATSRQLAGGCLAELSDEAAGFRLGGEKIPAGDKAGAPGILVAESCEYNRSFHNLRPTIASISSVEADHLDIFGTLDAVVEAFREFALLLPPASEGGFLLIAHEGAHRREIAAGLSCEVQTIGYSPEADWVVSFDPDTRRVTLRRAGAVVAQWCNLIPGGHNAVNACTALVLAMRVGADPARAAQSLSRFRGIDRRLQFMGERAAYGRAAEPTVRVFDDYGHHPTEVDVTLRALRESEDPQSRNGRLICVFQPHQHSRTRHLMSEFETAFSQADVVIVPHIYFVRDSEEERQKVSAADLVDRLRARGVRAMHLYPFGAIVEQLEAMCRPGDVVVTMGAGDVWRVAREFLAAGHRRS